MQLPTFGQNQDQTQQYYYPQPSAPPKRKVIFGAIGVAILIIAILALVFGGGSKPGQDDMRTALQSTSDALGIIDHYQGELQYSPTKNDVALTQILLRGNFQKLNTLYNTTYKPRKKFSLYPRPDTTSKDQLDRSERNNTLDTDIITALQAKVKIAEQKLAKARPSFSKPSSVESIKVSIEDMQSIETLLARPR